MSKVSFKTLIKETRKLLKISNLEKKQIYQCIDNVVDFLRSSQINENQVKVCSSFLSTFMHLLKSLVYENKIIEEDDEEQYSDKVSSLLSFYIDSEVKRLKLNIKDHSKLSPEKIFVEKIAVKCRVYDRKNDVLTIKSLGKFLVQNEFHDIFDSEKVKTAFNKLLKKLLNLEVAPTTINSNDLLYQQVLSVWHRISDDLKTKELIEKYALDHNLKIESSGNGRFRQSILQPELYEKNNGTNGTQDDIFEHITENEYLLNDLGWMSNLVKIPYKADDTVDLTVDSDDSDIEVELPPPVELINVDDDEQDRSFHDLPSLYSPRTNLSTNSSNNNRICIQERRDYIATLKNSEKPSFSVLRRQSIMLLEEERKRAISKKCAELNSSKTSKKINTKRKAIKTAECFVHLWRIPKNEIEKFRKGKLKTLHFIKKYENDKNINSNRSVSQKRKTSPKINSRRRRVEQTRKRIERPQVAKKSSTPNTSSYHPKSNLSVQQILGKEIISSTPNTLRKKRKKNSRTDAKPCNQNDEDNSMVNVNHEGLEWQSISDHPYAHSPWVDPMLNIEVNNSETIHVPETQPIEYFDSISNIEQNESTVNADLLEEILGPRASNYLPEVHASMNSSKTSNVSTSQEEDTVFEIPKKRKYTKRSALPISKESNESNGRPKRIRKERKFDY